MTKDRAIWTFLAALADAVDPSEWTTVDHWEAAFDAIGITRAGQRQPLVYVCSRGQVAGHYWYECEEAAPVGSEMPYVSGRSGAADLRDLLRILGEHLRLEVKGALP